MKAIRIHFADLSYMDYFASESQMEEFQSWLRFANQDDMFTIPGADRKIRRRDIARFETAEK